MNIYDLSASMLSSAASEEGMLGQVLGTPAVQELLQAFAAYTNSNGSIQSSSPRHQFSLQSYLDLTSRLSFDNSLYFVSSLPAQRVSSYTRLDSRVGWKLSRNITFSLVGQNLLSPHHLEFGSTEQAIATEVTRAVFGKVVWTF